jgi:hypothetical protein
VHLGDDALLIDDRAVEIGAVRVRRAQLDRVHLPMTEPQALAKRVAPRAVVVAQPLRVGPPLERGRERDLLLVLQPLAVGENRVEPEGEARHQPSASTAARALSKVDAS